MIAAGIAVMNTVGATDPIRGRVETATTRLESCTGATTPAIAAFVAGYLRDGAGRGCAAGLMWRCGGCAAVTPSSSALIFGSPERGDRQYRRNVDREVSIDIEVGFAHPVRARVRPRGRTLRSRQGATGH